MKTRKNLMLLFLGIFIGIVTMLVVSANFNGLVGYAAANRSAANVALGANEPTPDDLQGLQSLSKAFAHVAKMASPAVVTINSEQTVKQSAHPFLNDPFFRQFFNVPEEQGERVMRGLGSGVIVNPNGYIITNNHVISDADEITVTIDKKEYDAKVIGKDPASDLAVIKIDKTGLPTINIGNSEQIEVGEWVLAIGNPFSDELQNTVTAGIVSAKGRSLSGLGGGTRLTYQDFIQTDAAINPGNSGGALVNLKGELVGINTAIVGQANVGIGFAIPANLARNIMDQLINKGKVTRGWLGVYIQSLDADMTKAMGLTEVKGALVQSVVADGPAGKAGLQKDDIILKINETEISGPDQLTNYVAGFTPGTSVDMVIWRDHQEKTLSVRLGERPAEGATTEESQPEENAKQLGLTVQELTDELAERLNVDNLQGVVVTRVTPNSPADRKGIERGDIITTVNNKPIKNLRDYNNALKGVKEDDVVLLRITRDDTSFLRALRVPKKK
jgi:serine protease Do